MPASIRPDDTKPDPEWLMPDALWEQVKGLLPPEKPRGPGTRGGRPLAEARRTMDAIFYVLRTGAQWKALPRSLGSGSTAHRYFQQWATAGVFERLWRAGLEQYDVLQGIQWDWLAADGAMGKAPLAARRLAPIPPTGPSAAPNG
jgi:putative transposase